MDHGIWATWYDLPEGEEAEFLDWAHQIYLPSLLARPGYAWAAHYRIAGGGARMDAIHNRLQRAPESVATGSQFLMMVGAPSPHVFFRPSVFSAGDLRVDNGTGSMLSKRVGTRECIFCEEARVNGPDFAACAPGATTAPAIQMGSFRTESVSDEYDLAAWYAQYRFPAMSRMQGCIRTRKLLSVAGWAKHSVMYEFTSLEARQDHFQNHESLALDEKEWTNKIITYTIHAPGSPSIAARIWPPVGAE